MLQTPSTTFLLLFVLITTVPLSTCSNLIEDITDQENSAEDPDDKLQTFPTPPPIGTTTSTSDALFDRMNEILKRESREKSENFQIFNEKDLVAGANSNPYTTRKPKNRKHRDPESTSESSESDPHHQVIAGIPDLSDPCFRRYENSIIVNAQPYERRSSTGLMHCKSHCLNSQIGVYSCRSFVYDNVNRVCDLFAHVGDQSPARLLKFQTRDYFEPTDVVHCLNTGSASQDAHTDFKSNSDSASSESEDVTPTSTFPTFSPDDAPPSPPPVVALATNTDKREDSEAVDAQKASHDDCPRGKQAKFLKTDGFELFKHDDQQVTVENVEECAKLCAANTINGSPINCKSFDFDDVTSTCSFTSEAAVPVGNGQLKQREEASYYEKICVASSFVETCPSTFFSRYPQMILVGFAESVSDSPSFEHCFDTCLNSYQLFGFNCTSGMYYFEENQLNCILNSENRNSQKELFAEENTDIVDYFEVGCAKPKMSGVRNFETDSIPIRIESSSSEEDEENGSKWESWSECQDGKQTRRKSCANFNKIEDCAEEVRDCAIPKIIRAGDRSFEKEQDEDVVPTKEEIAEVKQKIRRTGFKCPLNECCRVFLSCTYGLRHNSHTKQLEWCRRPCDDVEKNSRMFRRLL